MSVSFVLFSSAEDYSLQLIPTLIKKVAPIEIHEETLLDVEEQLRFLLHVMKGGNISYFLPLLKGSFSSWIWTELGIPVGPFVFILEVVEGERS